MCSCLIGKKVTLRYFYHFGCTSLLIIPPPVHVKATTAVLFILIVKNVLLTNLVKKNASS